ncbi:MAG: flavodoxin family protein [Methanomassiliicoccales archaeon]|nr:flavodoxin family protein [Methanomassiliicoccales archaeon]TFG54929.1 MAG: flavodoxin family protein [Methanomassiliicoccus sp.]
MKIVFVNGSPRSMGNTGTMLKALAQKAKARGADVTYFEIAEKDVQDCDGCYRCDSEDKCSKDDDMSEAYALMQEADVFILGSPIYMGVETGMTKCFVDRLYYLMTKKRIQPGKRAVALFTCGLMDGHMIYGYMHGRFSKLLKKDLGFDEVKTVIVPGMKNNVNVGDSFYAQEALVELEEFIFPTD